MNIHVEKEAKVGLEGVARFIATWLERSRTLPLTIHLKIAAPVSIPLVNTIFESLCEHASRWESMFVQQPYPSCVLSPTVELPLLQSFKFDYEYGSPDEKYNPPFASAPRLTCLHWPHHLPVVGHPSVPWYQLRDVRFTSGLSPHTIVEILRNCSELLELEAGVYEEDTERDSLLPCKPRVLHQQLYRLDITIEAYSRYKPMLTFNLHPQVHIIQRQCLHLLSRSKCMLDKLTLHNCAGNAPTFLEFIQHGKPITSHRTQRQSFTDDTLLQPTQDTPLGASELLLPNLSLFGLDPCVSASPGMLGRMIFFKMLPIEEGKNASNPSRFPQTILMEIMRIISI
ncbi:hypothetical protein AX17_004679 [Amanita inopinata Kibby_2008]|nr:hypothetical protein AX17_004679 [Amanita inopinata Kibby_2008]